MMRLVPLGGYLGAGKTTAMLSAAKRLEQAGERVSIVTNDQGTDLVDTQIAQHQNSAVGEITGGCFCCRFEDLTETLIRLRDEVDPTVIFAEAVGSCTDLQSTVIRPLRRFYGQDVEVSHLTVLVDPARYRAFAREWTAEATESNLAYLYRHQLDEADVLALNKLDLLNPDEVTQLSDELQRRFPHAQVVTCSARTGIGLDQLIGLWTGRSSTVDRRVDVDYNRYGTAEAELAWANQVFDLESGGRGKLHPVKWVEAFLASLGDSCRTRAYTIGHIKVRAQTLDGSTKASLTNDETPSFDEQHWIETDRATVTINARVKCAPKALELILEEAVQAASEALDVCADRKRGTVFSPGWPVPVHRL